MSGNVVIEELEQQLNILQYQGDTLFTKILRSLDNPYSGDELNKDAEELRKTLSTIQEGFQRSLLNNIRVQKTVSDTNVETPLDELVKLCNEQINTAHNEIEKLKKSTTVCRTRVVDIL